MGPNADRSHDIQGASDRVIVEFRRYTVEQVEQVESEENKLTDWSWCNFS